MNTPAPRGLASSWRLFGLVVVGVEHEAARRRCRGPARSGRRAGRRASPSPAPSRWARGRRPSWRPSYQRCHCSIGSATTSATSSPAVSYCTRRANSSCADVAASVIGAGITVWPRMYGCSTSGMATEPSAWRKFSTIAAHTRGTASAEPFSVWAISVPLRGLAVDRVAAEADVGPAGLVVGEPADRRHLQPRVDARRVDLDVEAAVVGSGRGRRRRSRSSATGCRARRSCPRPAPTISLEQRRALLGRGDGVDLDLVELVRAQQAPRVAARRAGLAPVARRVGHQPHRAGRPRRGSRRGTST